MQLVRVRAYLYRNMLKRRASLLAFLFCVAVVLILHYKLSSTSNMTKNQSRKNPDPVELNRNVVAQKSREEQLREDEETMRRFEKRLKTLKLQCPGWRTSPYKSNWVANKNFLMNLPRRILVCAVPKAGSTSWHMTVWAMRRKQAGLDPDTSLYTYNDTVYNHAMAGKLTAAEGKELITYHDGDDDLTRDPSTETSRRLILTRHPFARLISGWHQKFLPAASYADFLFKAFPQMIKYVKHKDPDHRMTWEDFASYVADVQSNPSRMDYHFTPAHELCKPCQYAYTYILKAESVDKDESWLLRRLNITDIDVGRKGVPPGGSVVNKNPSENIKKFMSRLDDSTRRRLYLVYQEDFKLFGYTFDFETLESGGFD